jgi:hypothetical protein
MSTTHVNSPVVRNNLCRTSDLSLLAARAAIELDNISQGQATDLEAVKGLAGFLESSIEHPHQEQRALMDPATETVVTRAFDSLNQRVATVKELLEQSNGIAGELKSVRPDATGTAQLAELRSFCAALSICASAYLQSLRELRPTHPFRK